MIRWLGVSLAAGLVLAGCGGSDNASGAGGSGGAAGAAGAGAAAGAGGQAGAGGAPSCSQPPRDFWTWDLSVMPPTDVQVNGTCVAATDNAYVYVATDTWNAGGMTQAQVDTIAQAFEKQTPADATRGIFATDTQTFGAPPDVDADPHIILFYYPMGSFKGQSFDGFFRDTDESPGASSNQAEMLHLNAAGPNAPDSDYMLGVVIHELVHLINWKYDTSEEGWLNEALAESAMTLGGYKTDVPAGGTYVKNTATTPLCVSGYPDYGAVFSWGTYMLDRWGTGTLKDILQDPAHGPASVESHLPQGTTFRDAFGQFMVANLVNVSGLDDGRWGYKSVHQAALGSETAGVIDGADHDTTSVAWGARMLRLKPSSAGTLTVTLSSPDYAKLVVHTVLLDPSDPTAIAITPRPLAAASTTFDVALTSSQSLDVVLAVDDGASVAATTGAPTTTITYNASLAP